MELKKLVDVDYHPINEQMLEVLKVKVQNFDSDLYFRALSSFFMCQMASSMRAHIHTEHRGGSIPINSFVCGLMESGGGKGHSLNVLEDHILQDFKRIFMRSTFPDIAELNMEMAAAKNAATNSSDQEEEVDKLKREYHACGPMPFNFDSGTGPAFKQIRTKAQIAGIGALSMICDEIGTNLLNNAELFAVNLEAYDVGKIKQKITKQSSENKRSEDRDEPVPSNMLIFGTPSKLFNGGKEEAEFYSMLETGYARRLLFAIGSKTVTPELSAEAVYKQLTDTSINATVTNLSTMFAALAASSNYNRTILLEKPVALINIQYQLNCEVLAEKLPSFETVRKAEMQHRYFKALKLAGAYAFIDDSCVITEDHMYAAIKLVEDSGEAFAKILARDKPYVRLAKYIVESKKEVTQADLVEALPFFGGSMSNKNDMISLATAWGYNNNIIVKRSHTGTIEFLSAESLKETDLSEIIVSYSNHVAYNYVNQRVPFDKLDKLTQLDGYHWVNHHLLDGHRCGDNVLTGFNTIVIDVDGMVPLKQAQSVLKEFMAHYYTTKRHTDATNRFRIILPLKYELKLNERDFKEFMVNIYEWLPFDTDVETNQRCKKWLSHKYFSTTTDGVLLDPLPFIPKTAKNQERVNHIKSLGSLDRVERWFAGKWEEGGRNNTLVRYGLMLLEGGKELYEVNDLVIEFNSKMDDGLPLDEIKSTVLRTIAKRAAG